VTTEPRVALSVIGLGSVMGSMIDAWLSSEFLTGALLQAATTTKKIAIPATCNHLIGMAVLVARINRLLESFIAWSYTVSCDRSILLFYFHLPYAELPIIISLPIIWNLIFNTANCTEELSSRKI
jgi:hypothetical protein